MKQDQIPFKKKSTEVTIQCRLDKTGGASPHLGIWTELVMFLRNRANNFMDRRTDPKWPSQQRASLAGRRLIIHRNNTTDRGGSVECPRWSRERDLEPWEPEGTSWGVDLLGRVKCQKLGRYLWKAGRPWRRRTVDLTAVGGWLQTGRRGAVEPGTGGRTAREERETAGNGKKGKRTELKM